MIVCYKYVKPLFIFFKPVKKEQVEFKETFKKHSSFIK